MVVAVSWAKHKAVCMDKAWGQHKHGNMYACLHTWYKILLCSLGPSCKGMHAS